MACGQGLNSIQNEIKRPPSVLESPVHALVSLREFHSLEQTVQKLGQSWRIAPTHKCRKRHFDELCEDERLLNVEEHFKVSVFYAYLVTVIAKLTCKFSTMQEVSDLGFINLLKDT